MADGFGIDWNILANTESPLNGYIRGKQYADQRQQNMLANQRQAEQADLSRQEFGLRKEQFGLEKNKDARETASASREQQLAETQRLHRLLTARLAADGPQGAASAWDEIQPSLPLTGIDPAHVAPMKEAFLKNPKGFLDTIAASMPPEKGQVVSPGASLIGENGRVMFSAPFKQEYQAIPEGGKLVPVPQGPAASAAPAGAPALSGSPRNLRNNNPGNIEDGAFAQSLPGYKGSDGRFAIFDNPASGTKAQVALLGSYGRRGINTVAGIINRWAPPSDNNPTPAYAKFVAQKIGVKPDQPLDMNDPATLSDIASAIQQFEGGGSAPAGATQVSQGGDPAGTLYGNPKPQPHPMTPEEHKKWGIPDNVPAMVKPDGAPDVISLPGGQLKAVPPKIQSGYADNAKGIVQIDQAIASIQAHPKALGGTMGGYWRNQMGDAISQRLDPVGVSTRADMSNIGSLIIHDRSGAAVTAAETPRLLPFIPQVTDTPEAAIKKLQGLRKQYENANSEIEVQFGEDSGYRPMGGMGAQPAEVPRQPAAKPAAPTQAGPVRVSTPQEAMALKPGTVFITPDGRRKVR